MGGEGGGRLYFDERCKISHECLCRGTYSRESAKSRFLMVSM